MNHRITSLSLAVLSLAGIIAATARLTGGFGRETHFCVECGISKETRRVLWIPFSKTRDTYLSLAFNPQGRSSPHHWLFSEGLGGPTGSRGMTGKGRQLSQAINSKQVAVAVETIQMSRGDEVARKWMRRLLDLETSRVAASLLAPVGMAPGSFEAIYPRVEEEYDSLYPLPPP